MVAQHGGVEELGVGAVGAVPGVAAVGPRQVEGERGEEVVERPGDDDVVVEADVDGDEDHGVANSWVGGAGRGGSGRGFQAHAGASSPRELAPAPRPQEQVVRATAALPRCPPLLYPHAVSCHWNTPGRPGVPGLQCPQGAAALGIEAKASRSLAPRGQDNIEAY